MVVRSRSIRPALAATGLAMALVVSACSGADEGDGTSYVVGVPIVQSGPGGFAGIPVGNGIKFAEQVTSFAADYEAEFDSEPDMFAAQGYTAAWLMAEGIREAGSGDPEQVGEALAEIATQKSVYGEITYTDGQAELADPGVFLRWNDQGRLEEWSAS